MQKAIVAMSLAVAVFAVLSLVSGATYLGAVLPGGLPFGNALAALCLSAAAGAAVRLSLPGTALRVASLAALIASVAWLPASVALAGNLELDFSGWRGSAWLIFSLVVVVAVLCALAWALVASLLAMCRRAGAA
jgi:hypothetical protein